MNKYRIVTYNEGFAIQYKRFLFWFYIMSIADTICEFSTQDEAEEQIKEWLRYEKENGKIVKEY